MNIVGRDLVPGIIVDIVEEYTAGHLGSLVITSTEEPILDMDPPFTCYYHREDVKDRYILLHLPQFLEDGIGPKPRSLWGTLIYATLHECRHNMQYWDSIVPRVLSTSRFPDPRWERDAHIWAMGNMDRYDMPANMGWLGSQGGYNDSSTCRFG